MSVVYYLSNVYKTLDNIVLPDQLLLNSLVIIRLLARLF